MSSTTVYLNPLKNSFDFPLDSLQDLFKVGGGGGWASRIRYSFQVL